MLMPFIGHTLIAGVLMLNVYFAHWPVEATLGEAMWGIFGGGYFSVSCGQTFEMHALIFSYFGPQNAPNQLNPASRIWLKIYLVVSQVATLCNTYISDITTQSNRTARISLLDAFVMFAMRFGNLILYSFLTHVTFIIFTTR